MVHYCLPEFSDVGDFLALLAKRRGMLRKGGCPDVNKAAKLVLQDWNMSVVPVFLCIVIIISGISKVQVIGRGALHSRWKSHEAKTIL